jgi:hypothetical protein
MISGGENGEYFVHTAWPIPGDIFYIVIIVFALKQVRCPHLG